MSETTNTAETSDPQTLNAEHRATWLVRALCAGMLGGLLLSRPLWLSSRAYPLSPVWSRLPSIPSPWDAVLYGLLLGSLVLALFLRRPRPAILGTLFLSMVLCLGDQSRWQPWFYQYLLMLNALAFFPWSISKSEEIKRAQRETVLNVCRFLVASVYVWSGIQKINWTFVHDIFPWMVGPVMHRLPASWHPVLTKFAYVTPLVEIATGLGLMTVRGRRLAVISAVSLHLFIVVCLGPWALNWNSVVWPWNGAMIAFVLILFPRDRTPFLPTLLRDALSLQRSCLPALALLLLGVMPLLSFWGLWDSYLSLTLYSGNTRHAEITFSAGEARRLPLTIRRYVETQDGEATLDISTWSFGALNAPAYPETRVFRCIARRVCVDLGDPADAKLIIEGKPSWRNGKTQARIYPCNGIR